jgi:hypothetical protein
MYKAELWHPTTLQRKTVRWDASNRLQFKQYLHDFYKGWRIESIKKEDEE